MAVAALALSTRAAQAAETIYTDAHNHIQPRLEYALDFTDAALTLDFRLAGTPGANLPPKLVAGVSSSKTVLREVPLTPRSHEDGWQGIVSIRWSELGDGTPPDAFRLAFQASWFRDGQEQFLRSERYLVSDSRAPFVALAHSDPSAWTRIERAAYLQNVEDRRDTIAITVEQPMDGRLSLVIEDQNGQRIRNLVSGSNVLAGAQRIAWDGLDEDGNLVKPGVYTWRTAHHPGIAARYLRMFANGIPAPLTAILSNHGWFRDACANSSRFFVAASLAEGGFAIVSYDAENRWLSGYNFPHGTPLCAAVVAADERFLYAASGGMDMFSATGWGHNPFWIGPHFVTLTRFDIETRQVVRFPGKEQFHRIMEFTASRRDPPGLNGIAVLGERLYVAHRLAGGLLVFDKNTGDQLGSIPIPEIGDVAADRDSLLVISAGAVLRIELPSGASTPLTADRGHDLRGLSVDASGVFYVSDNTVHQIIAYDGAGREIRRYGAPGGPYAGRYLPERLVRPQGTAVFGERLVVTEDREQPKRFLQFSLSEGTVVDEQFGNPPYGGSGGGFDSQNPSRWIGMGCQWEIDPHGTDEQAPPRPISIFFAEGGHFGGYYKWGYRYRYEHADGRTFVIGSGFIQTISELQADGSLRDLAAFAAIGAWRYGCGWMPPQALLDALTAAEIGNLDDFRVRSRGVLWVDTNGDGRCQAEEFDILDADWLCTGTRWGFDSQGLAFTFGVEFSPLELAVVHLEPQGWHPSGAPRYPALRAAIEAAPRIAPATFRQTVTAESTVDRFGVTLQNGDPWMTAYGRDGALRWRKRNQWVGVHGSHSAPLPETGVMQGNLFFLGCAPLDEISDVTALVGNHGRFFFLSTDGIYLDETFRDVRMGGSLDDQMVGGEAFGGFFARAKDGRYYLQTGGGGYRIYEVHGLDKLRRNTGFVNVSAEQILAAERRHVSALDAAHQPRTVTVGAAPQVQIDGRLAEWSDIPAISWDRQGQFPVRTWMAIDSATLFLAYEVLDPSPWINNGTDWQTLFKTGDSVDLQLGTDPNADPKRRAPVPGDIRLLIAPFDAGTIAVLYRHRLPAGETGAPVTFTTHWRSETVDDVRRLDSAIITVQSATCRYRGRLYTLEAAIPLAELNWSPQAGTAYSGDFGVIYGDDAGTVNLLRSYWSNDATALVNDVPGEIMLAPAQWGTLNMEKAQ